MGNRWGVFRKSIASHALHFASGFVMWVIIFSASNTVATVLIPADQGWDARHSDTEIHYQFLEESPEAYCLNLYEEVGFDPSVAPYVGFALIDSKTGECLLDSVNLPTTSAFKYLHYRSHCPYGSTYVTSPQHIPENYVYYAIYEKNPKFISSNLWVGLYDDPGLQCSIDKEYYLAEPVSKKKLCEGNPCNPKTGNKSQIETDLYLPGTGLQLQRYYQSQNIGDGYAGLGERWHHNFAVRMDQHNEISEYTSTHYAKSQNFADAETACTTGWGDIQTSAYVGQLSGATPVYRDGSCDLEVNGQVQSSLPIQSTEKFPADTVNSHTISRPNGDVYTFRNENGVWKPLNVSEVNLVEVPSGWEFTDTDDTVELYDAGGRLQTTTTRNGWVTTLLYDGVGRLYFLTGPFGHELGFTYDNFDRLFRVTTPLGEILYGYDGNNNLETVTYPDGRVKQYHYEESAFPNHLTGITDENTNRYATWAYDSEGRATLSEHAGGAERVTFVYNGDRTTTVTDSRSNSRTYDFTIAGGELAVEDVNGIHCPTCPNGQMKDRTYDPDGYMASSSDWRDITTKYGQYDTKGQYGCKVEGVTASDASVGVCAFDLAASPDARRTDYLYDSRFFDRITSMTEHSVKAGNDKVTTTIYDPFGNRLSETMSGFDVTDNSVTRTSSYQYNGPLNQLSQIDGPRTDASDITVYRYYPNDVLEGNNRARLKEIEDANGVLMRSAIQYTATGKVESENRPNGLSLDYLYYPGNDRLQTLTESESSGDTRVTQWTYLNTGEVESITTGVGTSSSTTLTFGYDDARRLTRITDGLGNYVDYGLDTEGNRETETTYDANGTPWNFADDILKKQITQTFDVYNRLDTSSQANENQDLTFASDGTLDTQTDGDSVVTDYSYDALKRLTQTIQDQGGTNSQTKDATTAYGYDVADRLTSVTDPVSGNTTYNYDDLGNLLSQASPDTGTTSYLYDDAGNLTQKTDAKGQVFIYAYDALNRLTGVDAPNAEDDLIYTYDSCANGVNRLCTVQSATQTVHTTYDAFGEVTRSQGVTSTYIADKLESMTYPSGAKVSYTYDLAGQITQLDLTQNGTTETLVPNVIYAPLGPIEQLTFGNGLILTQIPDSAYRMVDQSITNVLNLTNTLFDANGNLTNRDETLSTDPQTSSIYGYDEINRLDSATGAFGTQSLDYDKNGNRTQDTLNSQVTPYTYTPNSNRIDQINALPVTLDANGNTEAQNNYSYAYTTHNRLKTATENTTLKASFSYNGLGQRNHKINHQTNKEKYFFYGENGELLVETDAHGNVLTEYIYLNGILITQYEPDSDQDGQSNAEEAKLGTNPTNTDTDSDGLTDLYELLQTGTSTLEADTDGDGSNDQEEIAAGTDPLNAASLPIINPPSTPVAAPGLQTVALLGLSILFLICGILLAKRGHHTPDVFFTIISLLILPNQYSLISNAQAGPAISGQLYFVHTDQLGTPRVMTDRNATVVWQATYDPFGKAITDEDPDNDSKLVENNVRFPGQYYDNETGLHYNLMRYYSTETGRYLTSDLIGQRGGLNTYAYVGGDPISYIDPLGLFRFCTRPLGSLPFTLSIYPSSFNLDLLHEQGYYEDGSGDNTGYFPDGIESDSVSEDSLTCENKQYDDDLMRQSQRNVEPLFSSDGYDLILNNCQDYADELRNEYRRLSR